MVGYSGRRTVLAGHIPQTPTGECGIMAAPRLPVPPGGAATGRLPPRAKEISERWIGDHAAWSLLVLRLLPFVSFNLINYAAGLSEVDFWTFLWTMAVGILPFSILLVLLGAEAARRSAFVLVLLAALVALVAAGQWLRRRTARATREQP